MRMRRRKNPSMRDAANAFSCIYNVQFLRISLPNNYCKVRFRFTLYLQGQGHSVHTRGCIKLCFLAIIRRIITPRDVLAHNHVIAKFGISSIHDHTYYHRQTSVQCIPAHKYIGSFLALCFFQHSVDNANKHDDIEGMSTCLYLQ